MPVHTAESFGEARQMQRGAAPALTGHRQLQLWPKGGVDSREADGHLPSGGAAVFHRILDQVGQNLHHLVAVGPYHQGRIRSASVAMIPRNRSRAAASSRAGPRRVSMNPSRAVSGVRNSWLTLATKSRRIWSIWVSADKS